MTNDVKIGARACARPSCVWGTITEIDEHLVTISPDPDDPGEPYRALVEDVRVRHEVGGEWSATCTITADNEGRVVVDRTDGDTTTVRLREHFSVCLSVYREDKPRTEWQAIALEWNTNGWIVHVQGDQHCRINYGETARDGFTWELACSGPVLAQWKLGEPFHHPVVDAPLSKE